MIDSQRDDGRGHWPAGKRRNRILPERQLAALLRRANAARKRSDVSLRGLARQLGVSDRTVRRWIDREDNPSPRNLALLQNWLDGSQG